MQQKLINHSPDLKRLRDEGYDIQIRGGYLVIRHVPYVNANKQICFGTLVSELNLSDNTTTVRPNHTMHFAGEYPCTSEGVHLTGIVHTEAKKIMFDDFEVQFYFSSKPDVGYYNDYYHKVITYISMLGTAAEILDDTVTARTFPVIEDDQEDSVFNYFNTAASRADIVAINDKLKGQKIAIVGLGGTGAYVLDMLAKTPVAEIHLYDDDLFHLHNAFRAPGAASLEQLENGSAKVEYYANVYSNMHKHIYPHAVRIDNTNVHELYDKSYVFVCVDKDTVRQFIFDQLIKNGIPFIDSGMGIMKNLAGDLLTGIVRVTTGTPEKNDHMHKHIGSVDDENEDYKSNIQIADLNMLNATLAVIKWKKLSGFYYDGMNEHHLIFSLNVSETSSDDITE